MVSKGTLLLTCACALFLLACAASSRPKEADVGSGDAHRFGDAIGMSSMEIPFTSGEGDGES